MLAMAFHRMMQCDSSKLKPVMNVFSETVLEIDEGQQMDMDFEKRNDVREEEYIEMIRQKTFSSSPMAALRWPSWKNGAVPHVIITTGSVPAAADGNCP
jgi:geranylgeranyl pyrophosphate synthase